MSCTDVVEVSAKPATTSTNYWKRIVKDVPPPNGNHEAPLKALIFDSYYDSYRGVVILIRIMDGTVKIGDEIRLMQANKQYQVTELGIHAANPIKVDSLSAGEVGYLCAQIKKHQRCPTW